MARAFTAKKSKVGKEIQCGRCQAPIVPGETYFYFSVGFRGSKSIRCSKHRPRQSELTGSKLSGAYAAMESVEDAMNDKLATKETIADALESAASDVESVRDEYQDSYDSLGDNFQNGAPGETIQEKIDGLDEFVNELNDAAQEVRDLEPSEEAEEGEEQEEPEDDTLEQAIERANDALSSFSL